MKTLPPSFAHTLALPIVLLSLAGLPCAAQPTSAPQYSTNPNLVATADLVENAARMISENYVFPDLGEQTAEMLIDNLKAGDYDGLGAQQLAQAISADLREFTKDLHFGARWQPPQPATQPAINIGPGRDSGSNGFEKIERLAGNIGYIDLRGFHRADRAAPSIHAAMQLLQGSEALIFDLRSNGGGDPETVQLLSSYLFDPSEPVLLNSLYFRPADETTEFWTTPDIQADAMPDTPVYVLTSGNTFSAAEEFSYNLKSLDRATIIGETTGGGAHPVDGFEVGDGIMLRIPVGRAINPITGTNWEGVGVSPDIDVPAAEALDTAHLMALQSILDANPDSTFAQWAIDSINSKNNPVKLTESDAASLVGIYGHREIEWNNGSLNYRRQGVNSTWRPLIALGNDTFMIEGVNDFRIVFERVGSKIRGIRGEYRGRPSDFSKRD